MFNVLVHDSIERLGQIMQLPLLWTTIHIPLSAAGQNKCEVKHDQCSGYSTHVIGFCLLRMSL